MTAVSMLARSAKRWARERDGIVTLDLPAEDKAALFQRALTQSAREVREIIEFDPSTRDGKFPWLALAELLGQVHYGEPVPGRCTSHPTSTSDR